MAANQLTPAELKEALSLLKQLKKGYADLGQKNPFAKDAENLDKVVKRAGSVENALKQWTLALDKVENSLEDVGKSAKGLFQQFNNIVGEIKKGNQNIDIGAKSMGTFQKNAEKLKNDQQGITRLSKTELETLQRQNKQAVSNLDIANKALQNQVDRGELEGEALTKAQTLLSERQDEATAIKDLLTLTEERLEKEQKIQKTLGVGGKLLDGLKKIPILGDILDVKGAKDAMIEAAEGGASGFKAMGAGIKALGPSLKSAMGPLALVTAAVEAIKFFVGAMFEADKQVTSLSKNLQISKDEARGIDSYFKKIADELETQYDLTKEIYQAQADLSELSAASVLYSKETLDAQIQLTKEYGLQAQDAANLNKIFITNDEIATDALDIAAQTTSQFFKQTGVLMSERKLLEQASKISGQILISFKGSTKELINAVAKANLLGISLSEARDISNSLLDFEQSISNEIDAELLTGKDLNLEEARRLSLQGKYIEATEAALKNVKSLEEFQGMNVIQQEALAKVAGVTVDKLSDSLLLRKLVTKENNEQYNRLKKAGEDELARRFALGEYDKAEIEAANKRINAQEKFNLSIDRIKGVFTDLVDGGALDAISDAAMAISETIASGGSLFNFFGDSDLTKNLEKKSLGSAYDTKAQLNEKIKNNEALNPSEQKRLKIAEERIKEKEIKDKELQRELRRQQNIFNEPKMATGGIVTRPTRALVGEAGAEAVIPLNKFYAKLDELISVAKAGGNVYLDGTKVGTAMNVSTYRVQ
jgi:hypothetical protein